MSVQPKRKEISRKLPPYEEMKRLYVECGWTYADIAEKYDVQRVAAYQTMKRRALAYGDPWPLRSRLNQGQKLAKSTKDYYVNPVAITEMVWEHIASLHFVELAWWEDKKARCIAKNGPHNCGFLHHRKPGLNRTARNFCQQHGFSISHLYDLRVNNRRIEKAYAVRLLTAIGEPIDRSLRPENYMRSIKHNGVRTPKKKVS